MLPKRERQDHRLARLTKLCLRLPQSTRRMSGRHAAFLVRGKTFAYYLDDHHGDGIVALVCKMAAGENGVLIAADPCTLYLPSYLGPKGWVAMRLAKGVNWDLAGS